VCFKCTYSGSVRNSIKNIFLPVFSGEGVLIYFLRFKTFSSFNAALMKLFKNCNFFLFNQHWTNLWKCKLFNNDDLIHRMYKFHLHNYVHRYHINHWLMKQGGNNWMIINKLHFHFFIYVVSLYVLIQNLCWTWVLNKMVK
jgi:hypothetical protein